MSRVIPFVDIQYTPGLDMPTLVREVNRRFRSAYVELGQLAKDVNILAFLASLRNFDLQYRNGQTIDVFSAPTDIEILSVGLYTDTPPMTVTPQINGTNITFAPPSPLAVTNPRTTYAPTGANTMVSGDLFQIQCNTGAQNDPISCVVLFSLTGLEV